MNVYPESVIAVARTQIGYCEKASEKYLDEWTINSGSGNFTKYARDMDAKKFYNFGGNIPKQGHDYCTVFIAWCMMVAGDLDNARLRHLLCVPEGEENLSAGAVKLMEYFKKAGRFFTEPKFGDIIFISWSENADDPDHVGLVNDVGRDIKAYTIEANRSNKVDYFAYPKGYGKVIGFGRPRYDIADNSEEIEKLINRNKILEEKLRNIAEIAA